VLRCFFSAIILFHKIVSWDSSGLQSGISKGSSSGSKSDLDFDLFEDIRSEDWD
jgi:hypothetical protein